MPVATSEAPFEAVAPTRPVALDRPTPLQPLQSREPGRPVTTGHIVVDALALAREEFLRTGCIPPGVRESTARSWRRSVRAGVSPDEVVPRFVRAPSGETALLRAARPIIDALFAQLGDSRAATMLVDAGAVIVHRWSNDPSVLTHLDGINAIPGYSFEESCVGTTALGSVIEEGKPVVVLGSEHFSTTFQSFSAVGAPVRHPITGRLEGVVDLVLPNHESSTLMLPLIVRAADEISARLLSGYSAADRCLLDGFLRTDRRGSRVPTIAINSRIQMGNCEASAVLGDIDRVLLWEQVLRARRRGDTEVVLAVGEQRALPARLIDIRDCDDASVGVVVQLRAGVSTEQPDASNRGAQSPRSRGTTVAEEQLHAQLPGRSVAWQALLRSAGSAATARRCALLIGEPGVGKRSLALAMAELAHADLQAGEFDARDAAGLPPGAWVQQVSDFAADSRSCSVILHLDELADDEASRFCRVVDAGEVAGRLMFATYTTAPDGVGPLGVFEERFAFVIKVPPLSERAEDIADVAEKSLSDRTVGRSMRLDPRTVHRLMEREWPGNARQLGRVVDAAIAAAPGSVVRPDDLPDTFRERIVRGHMTRLGRVEREAIREALRQTQGNKRLAATALGISRSTLYRKLEAHALGD